MQSLRERYIEDMQIYNEVRDVMRQYIEENNKERQAELLNALVQIQADLIVTQFKLIAGANPQGPSDRRVR